MELKKPHHREIMQFYRAFHEDFETKKNPPCSGDIFRDDECWEEFVLGPKLKRRLVVQKMIEPRIWNGKCYLQEDFKRFQLACWCCLEEDVIALLDHFKERFDICNNDEYSLKTLMNKIMGLINGDEVGDKTDSMLEYWCYFATGNVTSLELCDGHPFVYGMFAALNTERVRVEAVEYFWKKIRDLPEEELPEKRGMLFQSAINSAYLTKQPEVFEFCFSQIRPDEYRTLLEKDYENKGVLDMLLRNHHFDLFQRLFDDLEPGKFIYTEYFALLELIAQLGREAKEACTRIFLHLWMKEGFEEHRASVLNSITHIRKFEKSILFHLIGGKNLELLWAILDKLNSEQITIFMKSPVSVNIQMILKTLGNKVYLDKFLSYK